MTELRQSPSGPETEVPTFDDVADGQVPERATDAWVGRVAATVDKVSDGEVPQRAGAGWSGKVAATVDKVSDGDVAQRDGAGWSGKVAATVDKVSDGQVPQRAGAGWSGKVAATVDKVSDGQVAQRSGAGWAGKVVPSISTTTDGEVPVRSGAGWSSTAAGASAFDHVVRTVSDLPAAAGGYHDLTTGSWAFAAAINIGTNGLRIASGQNVYIVGLGWDKLVTSSNNSALRVDGTCRCDGLALTTTGDQAVRPNGTSYAEFNSCYFIGNSNAALLDGGSLGEVIFNACRLTGNTYGVVIGASAATRVRIEGCWITPSTDRGVRVVGGVGYLEIVRSRIESSISAVWYDGGSQTSVIVSSCWLAAPTGIDWASANIPSNGLLVFGNDFNCATPLSGHTAASARVIYRLNTTTGALMTETAIV